jgi:hypothetical protein
LVILIVLVYLRGFKDRSQPLCKDAEATMGVFSVDGPEMPTVESVEEMVGRFTSELITHIPLWKEKLRDAPERLEPLEREVHAAFGRGADLLMVGLLAVVMKDARFEQQVEQTRQGYSQPLQRGRQRTVRIRLLGGLLVWAISLYCPPRKKRFRKDDQTASGVYVELAQFGFGKGVSPALQSRVARQAALCPSLAMARQELARDGVELDGKAVRRIAYQCGEGLLQLRKHQLLEWRGGQLPAGDELAGLRVSVQIDGGRTKIRGPLRAKTAEAEPTDADGLPTKDAPGRSRKTASQTFEADWREPKLVTIFVHDEHGKRVKKSKATIDGTLLGPDAIAEIVAMHLHRLGAARARSVTFVADGAPWIWDRIARIIELAGLADVPTHQVLDCCHAAHHISLALAAVGLTAAERLPLYREHRTLLRNGQWRRVVEELASLQTEKETNKELQTELAYLRRHGEAGRLSYVSFRRQGLPLGSGAIESSIRRVINLRLKSNAIFWREENAEIMLQVRAQVVTDRWDERMVELGTLRRQQASSDWHWEPRAFSYKVEADNATAV